MIHRSTDIGAALRSRQRGFLLNPFRFQRSYEDLTTYTEVDGSARIGVTSSRVTWSNVARNATSYLYKDFGTNYFAANIQVDFDLRVTSGASTAFVECLAFTNQVGDAVAANRTNGNRLFVYHDGVSPVLYLNETDAAAGYNATSSLALNTTYFIRFARDEAVGTHGTIYAYVASSAANRAAGIWSFTLNVPLHTSKKDYRYLYAVAGFNDGAGSVSMSGYGENYRITAP